MDGFKLSVDKKTLLEYEGNCPEKIVIPDGVETIGTGTFKGKETLREVKFNSSVKTIQSEAFAKTGIQSVTLPASVRSLSVNKCIFLYDYGQTEIWPSV